MVPNPPQQGVPHLHPGGTTAGTPEPHQDVTGCSGQSHSPWDRCPHVPAVARSHSRLALRSQHCPLVKLEQGFVSVHARQRKQRVFQLEVVVGTGWPCRDRGKGRQRWWARAAARRDGAWSGERVPSVPAQLGAASPKATTHPRPPCTLWDLGAPLGVMWL